MAVEGLCGAVSAGAWNQSADALCRGGVRGAGPRVLRVFLGLTELVNPEALRRNGGVWFGLLDGRQLHVGVAPEFVPRLLLQDRSAHRLEVVQGAHPARMVKVG
ncbi:hypothetical protein DEIGR_103025 [Deinococcus grandis]|uniref:Uncharacterized protein n=1 Tax=Deinococcus grandis TaxID=57498 RepID=A0A100HLM4_9DEIO|nr:hypothetical protein DEGR_02240 [Deinococcus grandis]GAQ22998.1 hypothetical protein DEIGR_103025 [Deinococcus grandis]